jgi:hypothetical protein
MSSELIAALISSLLPIAITVIYAWLSSRNDRSRRRQVVDEAKQRIELISAYVASQTLVLDDAGELGAIKRTAARELYDIKAFLDATLQSMEKSTEKSESYLQRFFLLYGMRTGLASLFRTLFFIMLAVSVLWSVFISTLAFAEDMQELGLGVQIVVALMFVIPVLLIALGVRWLAVRFDKPPASDMHGEV